MSDLEPFQFARVRDQQLSIVADVQKVLSLAWRESSILATSLRAAVPQRLRRFVREQDVVDILLTYGLFSSRYDYGLRGLQSYKSVARAIEELRIAWKDNVTITIDDPGEHGRVSIRYFVTPHIY